MKRLFACCLAAIVLLGSLACLAFAAPEAPQITLQPQNVHYPEYSTAGYLVRASGTNLTCTWYLEYQGKTYNLSDNTNGIEPWEGYAGETYGATQPDSNSFFWFFGGIGAELSGAEIWCVIEDGHYDVTSARAIITVQGSAMPPEILEFPAELTVTQGSQTDIRCVAKSPSQAQLEFRWYETSTGKLQDIRAIDPEETGDFITPDTSAPGVRYYVCGITTTDGGMAYSSVLPVTVQAASQPPAGTEATDPAKETTEATEATKATDPAPDATATGGATGEDDPQTPATDSVQKDPAQNHEEEAKSFPWWGILLIALASAGAGVGAAFLLLKKKN